MKKYKVIRKQEVSEDCFVCGIENKCGINADFYEVEENRVVGVFNGNKVHQSYPKRMHGGITSAILDETIGRSVKTIDPDTWGVTTKLNLRYLKPVPLDEEIYAVGIVLKNTRLLFKAEGYITTKEGEILAEAKGTYYRMLSEDIKGTPMADDEWFLNDKTPDRDSFMLPR